MAMQRRISRSKLRSKIGQRLPLLVEGRSTETDLLFTGRLEGQAPEIDGCVLINDFDGREPAPGEFRWARIGGSGEYDLVAKLEAEPYVEPALVSRAPLEINHRPQLVHIQAAG
jgi:ribosomal protein S12 methylthiotransferase